jgi:iron complex outermembrane recepter protein
MFASRRALCLALGLASFSQTAQADADAETSNADIVITGIRQAYRGDFELKEIPQTISVIEARTLEENAILRLTDALDLNASVARQNNFGGLWDAFAVRGFAGDENLPSGYLVNGFNSGRGFGGVRDVAGVERIEVLRGPSAALLGRGEPGGTVNIVTKRARFDGTMGSVSALYGSFQRLRGDADVNIAINKNVAIRLIGFYEEADSFRDTVSSQRHGFLPSVSVRLGEDTTVSYDLEYTRSESDFDRGIVAVNGRLNAIPRTRFLGEPGDGPLKAEVTGHQLQLQHAFSEAWSLLLGGSYRETSLAGFSTEPELAASRQRLFTDGRSLSRQRRFRNYDAEHVVVRGELSGDFELGGLRNRVLIGADYDKFDNSQLFQRYRPPAAAGQTSVSGNILDIVNPVYGQVPLPTPGPLTNRLDVQKAVGAYVQNQISLSDRVQIRLGGRYDDFSLRSLNRANGVVQSRSANRFSPQLGLVFEVSPALSLYAAYGEGFRSNIGADAAGRVFDPETSKSFEAGAKLSLLDGALTGTVAAFGLNKSNVLAADPANAGFSVPIGKAGSKGVEVDVVGKLPGKINVLFSYAFVDAESRANVLDANFSLQVREGDPLINIPRHSLNAQISKGIDIGTQELRIGAGVQHVGERLGETATSFKLPAYTLVRLFANVAITDRIELIGEIKNLFNESYYTNSFASLWVQPGAPRTGSLGIRARF